MKIIFSRPLSDAKELRRCAALPALLFSAVWLALNAATSALGVNYFSSSFGSLPAQGHLYGDAQVSGGALKLTTAAGGTGSLVLDDLDCGRRVTRFIVQFDMWIGGGNGADGLSFCFAPDLPNGLFAVEGAGSGLIVTFDSFANSAGDCAQGIELKYRGQRVACFGQVVRTGGFVPIIIELRSDGLFLVFFNSGLTTFYANSGYTPSVGRFGFGASTGALTDNHWIRNLLIYTEVQGQQPPVLSCPPAVEAATTNVSGAAVSFTVTASDDCPGQPAVSCSPASGSLFPVGLTSVTCYATDADNLTSQCSFPVWVVYTVPVTNCPRNILISGTNMDSTIRSNLAAMGHTSTTVAPANFASASFAGFDAIWLGGGTSFPGLPSRKNDLINFMNAGGVVLAELTAESNPLNDYPLTAGVQTGSAAGDAVRVLDHCHPLNARLVGDGLSGWGFSYHGVFTNLGPFIGVTDNGTPGRWATITTPVGAGRLIYTAQDISEHIKNGADATGPASPKGVFLNNALTLGCPAVTRSFAGPDVFGYTAAVAPYTFEDISSTGTRMLDNTDDASTNAPIGFEFVFYDRVYSSVQITPNGELRFWTNELPSLPVLWDDWVSNRGATDAVYYQTLGSAPNRRLIVQWHELSGYSSSPSAVTFQAILFEGSNDILYQYRDAQTDDFRSCGNYATVGIRDYEGQNTGRNLQWSYHQSVIHDGEAIRFRYPAGPIIATQPQSQTVAAGDPVALRVIAAGAPPLSYQWRLNGAALPGATNATLNFASIQSANAGAYDVIISNSVGNSLTSAVAVVIVTTCAPLQAGLVSWWRGEDNALDRIRGSNGTLFATTGFAPGQTGQAFRFDGTNDYVQTPRQTVGTNYSVVFWFNPAAVPGAAGAGLVANDSTSANFGALSFTTMGELQYKQGNTVRATTPPGLAQLNQWYHAALTHDGMTTRLYLNGVLRATSATYAAVYDNPLTFAAEGARRFAGRLDELMLFNRALSSNEVTALLDATAAGICIPPFLDIQPASTVACADSNAFLFAQSDGSLPLQYQWWRNGVPVPGETNNVIHFYSAATNHSGDYTLTVSNPYGSMTSAVATLTVFRCTVALPDTLAATQHNAAVFDFAALTANDLPGSLNPTNSWLVVAGVSSNSAAGGTVSVVATQRWVRTYDGPGHGNDDAEFIAFDSQGNLVIAGESQNSNGAYDFAVIKYSSDGAGLWTNSFNGPANLDDVAYGIAVDGADNVIVTGYAVFNAGPDVANRDAVTIKYSAAGVPLWTNRFNGPETLRDEGRALAVDAAGNIFVTCLMARARGDTDFYTFKLSPTGTVLWSDAYNGPATLDDAPAAIAVDGTGNVYVTGQSHGGNSTGYDYVTLKYSSNGSLLWTRRYDEPGPIQGVSDYGYALAVDPAGNVHVTGESGSTDGTGNQLTTVKYDTSGAEQWQRRYNGPGNGNDRGRTIALDAAGNPFVTGFSRGAGTSDDYVTISYAPDGTQRWVRRFDLANGSDTAISVAVDHAGNAYVTGYADTGGGRGYDFVTLKYANDGTPHWTNQWDGAGSSRDDIGYAVAVDDEGRAYVTGRAHFPGNGFDFATLRLDQQVRYVPPPGFFGTDTFTYVIADSTGAKSTGLVTVVVAPIPVIASLSATNGAIGSTLSISGTGFDAAASNNVVWFGAVRAQVVSATSTQLVVTVPAGATYAPVTVTVGGFTASSRPPFTVTFPSNLAIDASTFSNRIVLGFPPGSPGPDKVSVGDVDGDGKPDICVSLYLSNAVAVFRNIGTGGLSAASFAAPTTVPAGAGPVGNALADVDGDGKPDLIVADHDNGKVSVLRNVSVPGEINFTSAAILSVGATPERVVVADFDGDGRPDIMVSDSTVGTTLVYAYRFIGGPGSIVAASFAGPFTFTAGARPIGPAVADFDRDGKLDLAVADRADGTVSVLRNGSTPGNLAFSRVFFGTGSGLQPLAAGDLDGDGWADLAVVSQDNNVVSAHRNTSSTNAISFAGRVDFAAGSGPYEVVLGDLNGDGKPDFAAVSYASETVSLRQNTSTPGTLNSSSFGPELRLSSPGVPHKLAIADLDGDSRPDIIAVNYANNTLSVFRNLIPPPPPAITSLSAPNGPVGSTLAINGENFSTEQTNNIVWFGAVRAQVVSATSTQLVVTVPTGAAYAPITVTVGGLTGASALPFSTTFPSDGTLGTNSFTPRFTLGRGPSPGRISIGDLDGDGRPDLVNANVASNGVVIYRNLSTAGNLSAATFAAPTNVPTANESVGTALADVDGDGRLDLVVSCYSPAQLYVFRNAGINGTIAFDAPAILSTGPLAYEIAVTDLDGDGRMDIAVANNTQSGPASTVTIYRFIGSSGGITAGSFAPRMDLSGVTRSAGLVAADLDRDGRPDLAVTDYTGNKVRLFRNTGQPGALAFDAPTSFDTLDTPVFMDSGDLDGDGKLDLAFTSLGADMFSFARNNSTPGTLSFPARVDRSVGDSPAAVALGDLNGDGKPDAAVSGNVVALFRNTASPGVLDSGSFAARVDLDLNQHEQTAIVDLDGDGRPDVIAAASYAISIWRNINPPPPPAITAHPHSRAAAVGSTVAFSVTATTYGVTNFQWRFNGTDFAAATNRTLTLTNVQTTNFGTYAVVVSDGTRSTTSSNAVLSLAVRPGIQPPNLNGTTLTMSFPTEFGPTYVVEYKARLEDSSWSLLTSLNGTGSNVTVTDSTAGPAQRFYRIRLE